MIMFKDFTPPELSPASFFSRAVYANFQKAVDDANAWLAEENVRLVNIETVVLPNIDRPQEEGSTDSHLRTSGEISSYWRQVVRVWYEDIA